MKQFFLAIIMLMSIHTYAQSDYDVIKDKDNTVIFKGSCTFEDLNKESSFTWLKKGMDAYKPDSVKIAYLKKNLPKYQMIVFLGTWCDDSHFLIPRLEKVLKLSAYPMSQYMMYGMDRNKKAKNVEDKIYSIVNVPTIIVYKGNMELGRIVETAKKNIETDLVNIIKDDVAKDEQAASQAAPSNQQ